MTQGTRKLRVLARSWLSTVPWGHTSEGRKSRCGWRVQKGERGEVSERSPCRCDSSEREGSGSQALWSEWTLGFRIWGEVCLWVVVSSSTDQTP